MLSQNVKFKNRCVRVVFSYFFALGMAAFLLIIFSAVFGARIYTLLPAMSVSLFLPSILAALLFYTPEADEKIRWCKRIIFITCSTLYTCLVFILFRHYDSVIKVIAGLGAMVLVELLIGVPLWIIADRRERKKIEEINKKLQENEFE